MKSKFAQKFNHDPIASDYDNNIQNEDNPIRKGYISLMKWIKEKTQESNVLVDLGCGTGNTSSQIKSDKKIYCVDISQNMLDIAKNKLKSNDKVVFIKNDLLGFFDNIENDIQIDTVISTYAIHHLTQDEKHILFEKIFNFLPKGGKVIFGDLMFKSKEYENQMKIKYPDLLEDFEDELYWYIDAESKKLESLGFIIEIKRFSDLSWGIYGTK
jgi:putative AdoMet-dependent methyltransferase